MDHREILGKLTPEGKASLLSGRDFWSTRPLEEYGIPSVVFSDGPHGVRRQAEKSDHIGLNKSLPATCFPPGLRAREQLGCFACGRTGQASGRRGGCAGGGGLARPGAEHKKKSALRQEFRVFFGGSAAFRQAGGRICAGDTVCGRRGMRQAFCGKQRGNAAHGVRFRDRRPHFARDLPCGL